MIHSQDVILCHVSIYFNAVFYCYFYSVFGINVLYYDKSLYLIVNSNDFIELLAPVANAVLEPYRNPCVPSPCGPNSICQEIGQIPSCTCMPTFVGSPPNCKPECIVNSECLPSQACIQQKCQDPCEGACGIGALCLVSRHTPMCTCPEGYAGDAFTVCNPKPAPGTVNINLDNNE